MKLDRLRTREKIALLIMAAIVVLWAADRVFVAAAARQLRRLDVAISNERELMDYHGRALASNEAVSNEFARIVDLLGRVGSSEVGINDMKDEIGAFAKKTGVAIPSIEHRAPRDAQVRHYDEYFVDIAFEGSMKSLQEFLREVQESPSLLRVVRMSLAPGANQGQVKGTLTITKVVLSENEAAEAKPSADSGAQG
jgi:hypothetical protein